MIPRSMIEVLVGVDEIFDFRAAGELERFLDLVDAANVGIDEHRGAAIAFDDREVGGSFGADNDVSGFSGSMDGGFHGLKYPKERAVAS